jgi:hypothetical protein
MSRRGCSLPANARGFDPHSASISSLFGQVARRRGAAARATVVSRQEARAQQLRQRGEVSAQVAEEVRGRKAQRQEEEDRRRAESATTRRSRRGGHTDDDDDD